MSRIALTLSLLMGACALVACQSSQPEPDDQAATEQSQSPVPAAERPEPRQRREPTVRVESTEQVAERPDRMLPKLEGELTTDGYGMTMIIDGSSPDAFANSLELIAADTSSSQFQDLNSALEYLQFKSMPPGGLPEFYRMFDGLTAEEIIQMAGERSSR